MNAKTILAVVFTALCWISFCLDWDIAMYVTGFIALVLVCHDDLKNHFAGVGKMVRNIGAIRSIRKEVVNA